MILQEIMRHIREGEDAFAHDLIWCDVQRIDENDPHSIAAFLGTLNAEDTSGVAIMAPESPQVRDAIFRLQERGVAALPFISGQIAMEADWVGMNNTAAGATAAMLLGRFAAGRRGAIMVVAESMQSRDSLERRLGFDAGLTAHFPHLSALPSLETYGDADCAATIISNVIAHQTDIIGIYILSSEARVPLTVVRQIEGTQGMIKVAHERTPFTEAALRDGSLDSVIAQDAGHLVRSAVRKLKAKTDESVTHQSQERIRVEVLLRTNL